ncbi:uncharacterized protein LOC124164330 [Ischnura elegans]|uniref:uncharacterized protein LOC124164330 n=1 Tax=Ischnura elegans TaxID=197161 RepID=UPI001ED8718B|nr:uncharacterized protein LOC124164330 [Ischnura elegans]
MALHMNFRITVIVLVGIVAVISGQKLRAGTCPPLTSSPAPTLTIQNLVNTWRVLARSPSIHRHDWKCITYTFAAITANSKYSLAITGVQKIGGASRASGTVTVTGNNGADSTAGTYLTFELTQLGKTTKSDYYIVKTDNTNYIVLYACQNFLFGRIDNAIILALPNTADNLITAALNSLAAYGISRSDLVYPFTSECL